MTTDPYAWDFDTRVGAQSTPSTSTSPDIADSYNRRALRAIAALADAVWTEPTERCGGSRKMPKRVESSSRTAQCRVCGEWFRSASDGTVSTHEDTKVEAQLDQIDALLAEAEKAPFAAGGGQLRTVVDVLR